MFQEVGEGLEIADHPLNGVVDRVYDTRSVAPAARLWVAIRKDIPGSAALLVSSPAFT